MSGRVYLGTRDGYTYWRIGQHIWQETPDGRWLWFCDASIVSAMLPNLA